MSDLKLFENNNIKYQPFTEMQSSGRASLSIAVYVSNKLWDNYTIHPGIENKELLMQWVQGELLYQQVRNIESKISKEDAAYWNGILPKNLFEKVHSRIMSRMENNIKQEKEYLKDSIVRCTTFIKNEKDTSLHFKVDIGHFMWNEYLIIDGIQDKETLEKWLSGNLSKQDLDIMKDERVKKSLAHLSGFERGRSSKPNHLK